METLGIIGTAGRGDDAPKLTSESWRRMLHVSQLVMLRLEPKTLVSGGADWSDHLAVSIYLKYRDRDIGLNLYLPVKFDKIYDDHELEIPFNCGSVLNKYHRDFQKITGVNSFSEIQSVLDGGIKHESGKGFHGRNTQIAMNSTNLLTFTFGDGMELKDGGTKDTWNKFCKKENRGVAYHYNLTENRMYEKRPNEELKKW